MLNSPGRAGFPLHLRCCGRVLFASGELDTFTSSLLQQAVGEFVSERGPRGLSGQMLLDLSGITFIDCAGLDTLVDLRDLCARREVRLRVTRPSAAVRRLASLANVTTLLDDPSDVCFVDPYLQ